MADDNVILADEAKLAEIAMELPLGGSSTPAASRDDFGPADTVGKQLRHRGYTLADAEAASAVHPFGCYAGRVGGMWYVLVYDGVAFTVKGYMEYTTLDRLKQFWELD